MGGAIGSILIGAFANEGVGGFAASGELFGKQLAAVVLGAVYSYIGTMLILFFVGIFFRLKPDLTEILDPDKSFHGESAYNEDLENDSKYAGTNFAANVMAVKAAETATSSTPANEPRLSRRCVSCPHACSMTQGILMLVS